MTTIILDLDGTLLEGRFRHHACYEGILREHGYPTLGVEDYWERKRRRQNRRIQLAATGAEALYDTFLRTWQERIEAPTYLALDRMQPGVVDKLTGWRTQGIRLVLATHRQHPETLFPQLAGLGLDRLFDQVVVCPHSEGGVGKARAVREVLGSHPDGDRLWVGDTEADLEAARALGCPVWAVWCGIRTEAYLKSLEPDFASWGVTDVEAKG